MSPAVSQLPLAPRWIAERLATRWIDSLIFADENNAADPSRYPPADDHDLSLWEFCERESFRVHYSGLVSYGYTFNAAQLCGAVALHLGRPIPPFVFPGGVE